MASKSSMSSTGDKSGSIFNIGQERAEAAVALQKELLEAYEQASRAWLARAVRSGPVVRAGHEADSHPLCPEAFEAYSKCVSQRMQMTAEDGQRLLTTANRLRKKSPSR